MIIIVKTLSWIEFEKQMNLVFKKNFKIVDELYFNVVKQINFGERSEMKDLEVLYYLEKLHNFNGQLCVITDYCYEKKCGPFVINASEIYNFVKDFMLVYNQPFYASDVIIINFEEKLIWVLFHEGICWLSKGEFSV